MATPNPASDSSSGEGTRNVPRPDCSLFGDPKCLDTSLNLFFINLCNIRAYAEGFWRRTGSSNHSLISFSNPNSPIHPKDLSKRRCLRRFTSARWGDLR
ncbi:hypothetical protein E2C01_071261 [Portunus trituberculatus]|uniref:Uncharacterized protein n=1 Tax=Portunus trituberculatus TaxID=210409 RepID=A0A5B7I7I1_PORTR|nr:hypothetical protein [Portunus trituberculatus]